MRNLLIATFGLALLGQASIAAAATPQHACAAPVNALDNEWNAIGFSSPAKPAQAIVSGRYRYQTSGSEFGHMVGEMRLASRDCQQGKDGAALSDIEQVQGPLSEPGAER